MNPPLSISEIEIFPLKPRQGLVAFASFVVNGQLYVGDVAVHTRADGTGFRLVYPTKMLPNGKMVHVVQPINRAVGEAISTAVVQKLELLGGGGH